MGASRVLLVAVALLLSAGVNAQTGFVNIDISPVDDLITSTTMFDVIVSTASNFSITGFGFDFFIDGSSASLTVTDFDAAPGSTFADTLVLAEPFPPFPASCVTNTSILQCGDAVAPNVVVTFSSTCIDLNEADGSWRFLTRSENPSAEVFFFFERGSTLESPGCLDSCEDPANLLPRLIVSFTSDMLVNPNDLLFNLVDDFTFDLSTNLDPDDLTPDIPPAPAPAPVPAPAPQPAPMPMVILSDPHFKGLRGQEYDFTGEPGKIYNLIVETDEDPAIANDDLIVNSLFAQAWTTSSASDDETLVGSLIAAKGTWMHAIGITSGVDTFAILSNPTSLILGTECSSPSSEKSGFCLKFGGVEANSKPIIRTGTVAMKSGASLTLTNFNSYSRITVNTVLFAADFDVVPPVASWGIPEVQKYEYTHINMKIIRVRLSKAMGVLGESATLKYDGNGAEILNGAGADGEGVLAFTADKYEVEDLFSLKSYPPLSP